MGFTSTINSTTSLQTKGSTGTNLNGVLFITANATTKVRIKEYSSWSEVKSDSYISTTSNAYQALKLCFSQPNCGVPLLLGRRQIDSATLTPSDLYDNKDYEFTVEVYDTSTNETTDTYEVSINSGNTATLTSIATQLYTELATTQAADNINVVDNSGSITITADSGYDFLLSGFTKVADTYTTTETADEVLTEILEEDKNGWYFLASEDHTETFVLEMAEAVELMTSDDYPKMYRFSTQDVNSILPLTDPATDLLGKCYENLYTRTAGEWHHNADTEFVEVAALALQSGKDVSTNWKFMNDIEGVEAAQNPLTGKDLSTTKLGYLEDRKANFMAEERGVTFMHGGSNFRDGYWIDLLRGMDYINSEIETTLLDLLLDSDRGITYTDGDLETLLTAIKTVLSDAVSEGILSGYKDVALPEISSDDQIDRILDGIEWTGILAGHVNVIYVDGNLVYTDADLS